MLALQVASGTSYGSFARRKSMTVGIPLSVLGLAMRFPGEQRTYALTGLKGRKLFDVKGLIRFLRGGYCISLSTFPAASRRLPLPIRMENDSARHSKVVSRKARTKWR